jgi:deoxyribonuclease-4
MSIAGGVFKSLVRGAALGVDTIQIFTRNANRWTGRPMTTADVEAFLAAQRETGIAPVIAHNSYLVNLASPDPDLRVRSRKAMVDELERSERLGIPFLVIHPGSHKEAGERAGIRRIVSSLDALHDECPGFRVKIALETSAGSGAHLGARFEHLQEILEAVKQPERMAVCFDTCHVFAAGYDLRKAKSYETTMEMFHHCIGFERLAVIHLNDSRHPLGSRKDRHEHIGEGAIGAQAFKRIMRDPRFLNVPKIIETPKGRDQGEMDPVNLGRLRGWCR